MMRLLLMVVVNRSGNMFSVGWQFGKSTVRTAAAATRCTLILYGMEHICNALCSPEWFICYTYYFRAGNILFEKF